MPVSQLKLSTKNFCTTLLAAFLISSACIFTVSAHNRHEEDEKYHKGSQRTILFPDTSLGKTIIADLHTHSVFSDGHVWPSVRVSEAVRDGLDAIAITEHLEYQPHGSEIPNKDRNAAYNEALKTAKGSDLLVISGAEITREMSPGHLNALFIEDANKLFHMDYSKREAVQKLFVERGYPLDKVDPAIENYAIANQWPAQLAIDEANEQGGFIFWNHPGWVRQSEDGIARLLPMHEKWIADQQLHGIEVVNGNYYSEQALQIALDHNLAILGTSDVHSLIEWDYPYDKGEHRPVTLIFAANNSAEAVKKALFERRTAVWFKDVLIGKQENLQPLIDALLTITSNGYVQDTSLLKVQLKNDSSAPLELELLSDYSLDHSDQRLQIAAQSQIDIHVKTLKKLDSIDLQFKVRNAIVAPRVYLTQTVKLSIPPG